MVVNRCMFILVQKETRRLLYSWRIVNNKGASFVGKKKGTEATSAGKKKKNHRAIFVKKKKEQPKPAGSSLSCERRDYTPTIEKGSSRLKIVSTKERKILVGHYRVAFFLCVKSSLLVKPLILKCVTSTSSLSCVSNSCKVKDLLEECFETQGQGNSEMSYPGCRQSGYS